MSTFSEKLRAARRMQGWSLQELADKVGNVVTKQSLSKYEQGSMMPEGVVFARLAEALGVTHDYLFRSNRVELGPVGFRKKARLSAKIQGIIEEKVKDYLERYLEVETLLEVRHSFNSPFGFDEGEIARQTVATYEEVEAAAACVLEKWRLGVNPIPSVTETLEENGVYVLVMDTDESFHGLATCVSSLPVIVLNKNDTHERRRFTAFHELGHIVLNIVQEDEKEVERFCHRFASAMLLPSDIVKRNFGEKRTSISTYELRAVKEQFGISAQAIMRRLLDFRIIKESYYKYFCIKIAPNRQEKNMGTFCGETDQSYRFQQMIHRLVAEDIVSDDKAANLIGTSLSEFRRQFMPADE